MPAKCADLMDQWGVQLALALVVAGIAMLSALPELLGLGLCFTSSPVEGRAGACALSITVAGGIGGAFLRLFLSNDRFMKSTSLYALTVCSLILGIAGTCALGLLMIVRPPGPSDLFHLALASIWLPYSAVAVFFILSLIGLRRRTSAFRQNSLLRQ
jgi:hypothetical protein